MTTHRDTAQAWYVVLGGLWPGIKETEPIMKAGKFTPPLPVMVKAYSLLEAEDIDRINEVLKPFRNAENDVRTVIDAILDSPITATILPGYQRLYCVVYGHHSGIYLSYDDAIVQVNGITKAIFKHISEENGPAFKRAMIYMVTKGESEKGESSWEEFGRSQSSPARRSAIDGITQTFRALSTAQSSAGAISPKTRRSANEHASSLRPSASQPETSRRHDARRVPQSPSGASGLRHSSQHSHMDDRSSAGDLEAGAGNPPTTYIYQYIRSLSGIVRARFESFHDDTPTPSLGSDADAYLQAHGYTHEATMKIYQAYNSANTIGEFIHLLAGPRGIPVKELKYIWRIIRPGNGLTWAQLEID